MPDFRDEIRQRLAELRLDPTREAQIVDEMAQHLEDRYDELRRRGESEHAAAAVTLEELNEMDVLEAELRPDCNRAAVSEITLGRARGRFLESFFHDVRYAVRSLRASPGYTAASILTLALALSACTLIFSVANGVLLRPLPYKEPDRLVQYWGTAPEKGLPEVAFPEGLFAVHRDRTRTLEAVTAYDGMGVTLTGVGDPERIDGGAVSLDFFRVFGVQPRLGRAFVKGEDVPDDRAVILSDVLWRRRFSGRADIVGQTINLNGTPRTVVGVMPPGFDFPNKSELWMPMSVDPNAFNCWCFLTIGRMRPGVTPEDVRREMMSLTDDFAISRQDVFPGAKRGGSRIIAQQLSERLVGDVQKPLVVLLAAVGFVLLIACANIANLTLARAGSRAREIAVRCCLGASPRRIAAQLLTESIILSIAGAAAGLALALWGVQAVRGLPPLQFPRIDEVRLDGVVLLFTAGVAIATGLLCGIVPALRASRVDLQDAVKSGQRVAGGGGRITDAFVVVQFALSLVLLAGAGLLLRSYQQLLRVNLGYRTDNVLTARVSLPYPRYGTDTVVRTFYDGLLDRVRAIPGVRAAGVASRVPLSGGNPQDNVVAEGREPKAGEPVLVANIRHVSAGYFDAIGTPFLRGRGFEHTDNTRSMRVAVVDEAFARHFWPNESAVGKRFAHQGDTTSQRWVTIIGVVANVKHNGVDEQRPDLQVYETIAQRTTWNNTIVVRAAVPPEGLVEQLRRAVAASDPTIPLFQVRTMRSAVDQSLSPRRVTNALLGGFAIVALVLAGIGIYGVMALSVSGRTKEFGIRMALGAQASNVRAIVLRHGLLMAGVGVGVGLVGALGVTRFLRGLLFGVDPIDLPTFAGVAVVLSAAALLACYLPARRATRADPIVVLRTE
jgi:putative ABC transport system permease protein